MKKIVYPKLTPFIDLGFIRIGGPGLANCMITSARAYIFAQKNKCSFINPTWGKISIGSYLRKETDKRHYFGLFNKLGISGLKKIFYLLLSTFDKKDIIVIDNMGNYFDDLKNDPNVAKDYFNKIINVKSISKINNLDFTNIIGVHIRLGDYKNTSFETNTNYYKNIILNIKQAYKDKDKYKFYIFSDAKNDEIKDILSISGIEKVFFGNALADLVALSKTKLIIGSDSTFSGLAAYLNQTPIIFPKRHFGSVLDDSRKELIINSNTDEKILNNFLINLL
jgi:hypothetical protein